MLPFEIRRSEKLSANGGTMLLLMKGDRAQH
jgi:hypothetical protein